MNITIWSLGRCAGAVALICASHSASSYEINNHADLTQFSATISFPEIVDYPKQAKLGLKKLSIFDSNQSFPLSAGFGPIPYCFGSIRDDPFELISTRALPQQDPSILQPDWNAPSGPKLTIAQLFRYGACFEDSETPGVRPFAHFYNPQDNGAGLMVGPIQPGPSSLQWMLQPNAQPSGNTGVNHFTWMDAREYFYRAMTRTTKSDRELNWGLTFQSLGHVVHHLQDMAAPQHVRNDQHCSAAACDALSPVVNLRRPSGYETHMESPSRFQFVQQLAMTATAPMMFGLPREFWNANTTDSLFTSNPTQVMTAQQGIAAYTSTNFTSVGKDFTFNPLATTNIFRPASGLPFPRPSQTFNDVQVADLLPAAQRENVRLLLCGGDLTRCKMRFMGTETDPTARTSSVSAFSQLLLRPSGTYGGAGVFQQNYFTFDDAARKLLPKAVEYSAGLINYFFRGQMDISLGADGLYGLIDGGDPASTCKDACGFRKLKVKIKNSTAAIGTTAQDMSGGTLVAVVKFSRDNCYTAWTDSAAQINLNFIAARSQCLYGGGTEPVEEVVLSASRGFALSAGADREITLDFSANPIPVNAWNIRLQLVYRGQLGAETDAVVAASRHLSAPTVLNFVNEADYILINQQFYTRAQVNSSQALLAQVDCYYLRNDGTRSLDGSNPITQIPCYHPITTTETLRSQSGTVLAQTPSLNAGRRSVLLALGDLDDPTLIDSIFDYPANEPATLIAYTRKFEYNDETRSLNAQSFPVYRGLPHNGGRTFYWVGRASEPIAPWTLEAARPALTNPTPVPLSILGF